MSATPFIRHVHITWKHTYRGDAVVPYTMKRARWIHVGAHLHLEEVDDAVREAVREVVGTLEGDDRVDDLYWQFDDRREIHL